jgi:tetratricopeptide (TPR) repeat protein
MRPVNRSTPPRILGPRALTAGLLVCLALSGCNEVDPLEAVRLQHAAGDYEGSIEPLRELLATRPEDPETNLLYGRALAFTQGPNLAVWSLRKAMKDPEWLVPAGMQLAFVALVAGDFNEVVEITGRVLEREPDHVRALLMRANANAHWKKAPELALADAARVLELDPDVVEAYEPRIIALLDLERFEEAGEVLAEAGRRLSEVGTDESVIAWHCVTTAVFEQATGDLEQARETWIACLDAHPTNLDTVTSATSFYDEQAEPDRSLEVLRAALAGTPASRTFRVLLAQRLSLLGDTAEAEAVLREATRSEDPAVAAAGWLDLGQLRRGLGEFGAAADALERAVEMAREVGPADPQLLFEYADVLVVAGRLDRALAVAEKLTVPAHRALIRARVAQERRAPARALEGFDEGIRLWPDNPWARYYAALAAEELGDFKRALAEYRYAVRIAPEATDARTRGAALLAADGKADFALQMLLTGGEGQAPPELEAQLLFMRLSGRKGNAVALADALSWIETNRPGWAGLALAEGAEGLAERSGPAEALAMLATAPGVDFGDLRYAPALRALVHFSHQAGEAAATQAALETILVAQSESGAFQEIRGLDLELSGAPAEAVHAAYARALALGPGNSRALAGLGRLAFGDDPGAALIFFDRAAAADPSDPVPKLQAARALVASGKPAQAEERLDGLLLEHPFEAEAAAERAQLDLERGIATPHTLERALRAVRFGGGADALELLSRVHEQRDEPELAERATEKAQALRDAQASEG